MSRRFDGKTGNDKDEETLGSFYMGRMQPPPENERVLPRGLLAGIVVVIFAGILWYAYPDSEGQYDAADVPLIKADTTAYKFTPDDPGGMEVRHQDSTVFNPLVKKEARDVERLLPKPEEPLNKDTAIQSGDAAKAPVSSAASGLNLEPAPEEGDAGAEKVVPKDDGKKQTLTALATAKPADTVEAAKPESVKAEPKKEEKPVEKKAEKAAEKAATTTAGGFYMQLGAFRETAKADEEWRKLQKKFPQSLYGLSKRVEKADLGAKGTWYRLHAGPVAESKARDLCSRLKADGAGCMVRKL